MHLALAKLSELEQECKLRNTEGVNSEEIWADHLLQKTRSNLLSLVSRDLSDFRQITWLAAVCTSP